MKNGFESDHISQWVIALSDYTVFVQRDNLQNERNSNTPFQKILLGFSLFLSQKDNGKSIGSGQHTALKRQL